MPDERPPRLLEQLILAHAVLPQPSHQDVVRADERNLHLAPEHVHVVARIPDQRDALVVAWNVAVVLKERSRVARAYRYGEPTGPPP